MSIDNKILYTALAMHHNESLVKQAETMLNEMAEDSSIRIFLENDGKSIKLKPGMKLTFCQIIPIIKEESEKIDKND